MSRSHLCRIKICVDVAVDSLQIFKQSLMIVFPVLGIFLNSLNTSVEEMYQACCDLSEYMSMNSWKEVPLLVLSLWAMLVAVILETISICLMLSFGAISVQFIVDYIRSCFVWTPVCISMVCSIYFITIPEIVFSLVK